MAWQPLEHRVASASDVPFVLAGPQPRLVTNSEASIWVATREACTITLTLFDYSNPSQPTQLTTATATTRRLGARMHVAVVRATATLPSGTLIGYDLSFQPSSGGAIPLMSEAALDPGGRIRQELLNLGNGPTTLRSLLTYGDLDRPTFTAPASDAAQLRIIHASCRKPHGEDFDATLALHTLLSQDYAPLRAQKTAGASASVADKRPHHLFLGGDQIYADDVADAMMHELMTGIRWLLDGEDEEPLRTSTPAPPRNWPASTRARLSFTHAGLTAGVKHPELASSHLFSFAEFAAMYLYAWSPSLWPLGDLPDPAGGFDTDATNLSDAQKDALEQPLDDAMELRDDQLDEDEEEAELSLATGFSEWDDVKDRSALVLPDLIKFRNGLPLVRRAMANIPTLMLFDDHEITDDVFINRMWCERVFTKPLGRQVVRNGLAAYAIFQDFGNRPERYLNPVTTEHTFLDALEAWRTDITGGNTVVDPHTGTLNQLLGVPTTGEPDPDTRQLQRTGIHLDWSFHQEFGTYEVIALDGRTRRGYPATSDPDGEVSVAFAEQISEFDFIRQIPHTRAASVELTFVMAPIPVMGWPYLEGSIQFAGSLSFGEDVRTLRFGRDTEAWGLQPLVIERLLAHLAKRGPRSRVLLLSGDVHFGFTQRIRYKASKPFEQTAGAHEMMLVQCTASALKNETTKRTSGIARTEYTHRSDYEVETDVLGWNSWPQLTYAQHDSDHPLSAHAMPQPGHDVVLDLAALQYLSYPGTAPAPDWRWTAREVVAEPFADVPPVQRPNAPFDTLEGQIAWAEYHRALAYRAAGRHFVGRNNLGEVVFTRNDGQIEGVTHSLWWREARPEKGSRSESDVLPDHLEEVLEDHPYTPRSVYRTSLAFDDALPLPAVPPSDTL